MWRGGVGVLRSYSMNKGPGKRMQKFISITLKVFILKAQYSNKTPERK